MIEYKVSDGYVEQHEGLYRQLSFLTNEISNSYPGHYEWLITTFQNGLMVGERGAVLAYDNTRPQHIKDVPISAQNTFWLSGCSLVKNTKEEKKICCLFVDPSYRHQGIASNLIQQSFGLLKTDKPLMTVAENNLPQLLPLIKRFGFELTSVKDSVYKPGVKEYYYNEGLAR